MTSVLSTLPNHFSHSGMSNELKYSYPDVARFTPSVMSYPPSSSATPSFSSQFYSSAEPISESHATSHLDYTSSSTQPPSYFSDTQPLRNSDLETDFSSLAAIADAAKSNELSLVDSVLSFPALPADLLDEAPEYEFSTHTRTNVFEASLYTTDISTLAFGPDGLPMLNAADEHGTWPQGADVGDRFASSAHLEYLDDPSLMIKSEPRSVEFYATPSRHVLDFVRPEETFGTSSGPYPTTRSHPPAVFATPVSNDIADRSHVAATEESVATDARPSVLYPGPEALPVQQRPVHGYDTMFDSQAGPSRSVPRRSHDLHSATNSPHPYGRSVQLGTFGGPSSHSPGDVKLEDRRLSTGVRPHGRDPVVPSQNVGRARMMSWQSERLLAMGNREGQANTHAGSFPPPDGFGNPQGSGMQGSSLMDAMAMHGANAGVMTASRSLGYDMQHANGNTLSHHNMDPHATDMINALGDAMDARIDVDGIAKCPYPNCNKTFAKNRSYNLKAHLRSHSQVKPFSCSVCPRSFSRKHDLERHARVHSGDKPYLCDFCHKGFPRSDALRRHWRVEKECGDKEAAMEAGHSLPSVFGEAGGSSHSQEESPEPTHSHQVYQDSMPQRSGLFRQQIHQQQPPLGSYGSQQQWPDAPVRRA